MKDRQQLEAPWWNVLRSAFVAVVLCATLSSGAQAVWQDYGIPIYTAPGGAFPYSICSDGSGGAIMAWSNYPPGDSGDIYAQRVDEAGRILWAANGVPICTESGAQWAPSIVSDGAGGAFIGWNKLSTPDDNGYRQVTGYIQRVDGSGNRMWTASGIALSPPAELAHIAQIVADGESGVFVLLGYDRSEGQSGDYDVFAQRVDASGNFLWGAYGIPISEKPCDQVPEGIVSDGAGGAIITFSDRGCVLLDYDTYAQRVDASGNILWALNGVPICIDPTSGAAWIYTVPDGAGGAIVSWSDDRNGAENRDVFAQRLNASGNALWAVNGMAVCAATGNQDVESLAPDGAGGAIITWADYRIDVNGDIYAQRVNASGAALWTPGGIAVCSTPARQLYGRAVSDGAGGGIVIWQDRRYGDIGFSWDVFAQRLDASGAALWTTDGAPVCSMTQAQSNPEAMSDNAGGAFVIWVDRRRGVSNYDLYAQRIGPDGTMHTIGVTPSNALTNCATPTSVAFGIDQMVEPTQIRGYEVTFSIDPSVVTVANPLTDITQGTYLSAVGATQFYAVAEGGGVYTMSCAILGGDVGATGDGVLFNVLLTPVSEGTSAVTITSIQLRDIDNNPLPVYGASGSIRVDCTPPTMEDIAEPQGVWYNAAPVLSNFGFDDDVNLDLADYNYDGGSWTAIFSGIDAAAWDSDGWALPDFDGLSQGTHTVYFRVKDDAGNWNTATYSWQFYKDTVAPQPPTNFVAMPGHDKTHLTWTNPSGDATFVGVEIRFNGWVDYPEYATSAPAYPPDHTAGTLVTLAAGTSFDDNPRTPRDIYYYSAFSKDLAGNYSVLGTTAFDRCTSYWLGDVIPSPGFDGLVNISDLAAFSGTFAVIEGGGGWNAHCDFGPTDDHSRFGIPLPDNKVNFEDLMIFSMNYSKVTPAGLQEGVAAARVVENLKDLVAFTLVSNADGSISIVLANKASTLKGIHFVATVEGGTLERVDRGSFFTGRGDLFFGLVPSTSNTADISTAALGVDKALAGSGEVARLVIASDGASAPRVRIDAIDLRDLTNAKTELVAAEEYEAPFVPTATALMQNFPNPFNPVTTIAFDLTAAGRVRIDIYDVSGRLLATPVDAAKVAGRHQVEWNGKDASGSLVPSGIYFYRMKTAGYEATRKMILVR